MYNKTEKTEKLRIIRNFVSRNQRYSFCLYNDKASVIKDNRVMHFESISDAIKKLRLAK